jgi:hypothetical protein
MNLRTLTTAAGLLACVGGAGILSGQLPLAREAGGEYVAVYRNGDLEVNIRGAAGADVLRSGLANLFRDEPRHGADERRICAQEAGAEPLSLGMLGAGFALLGWTRRRGNWFDRLKQGVFPWPALCWLD